MVCNNLKSQTNIWFYKQKNLIEQKLNKKKLILHKNALKFKNKKSKNYKKHQKIQKNKRYAVK